MAEIAELTFDLAACVEVMAMVWKRINDHGKNWRHVYKGLVLLEHLARYGQESVGTQCRENLVAIRTLRDFQHMEDGKDQGHSVREKAKHLVTLIEDEERFRAERTKASKSRDRYGSHATAYDYTERSDTGYNSSDRYAPQVSSLSGGDRYNNSSSPSTQSYPPSNRTTTAAPQLRSQAVPVKSDIDAVRPTTTNEEDLQLQMALAMSKEAHEEDERKRKGDEIKLQMAIEESKRTAEREQKSRAHYMTPATAYSTPQREVPLNKALDDPWAVPQYSQPMSALQDPWGQGGAVGGAPVREPWELGATQSYNLNGGGVATRPYGAGPSASGAGPGVGRAEDEFSELSSRYRDPTPQLKNQSIENWLDSSAKAAVESKVTSESLWNDSDSDLSDDLKTAVDLKAQTAAAAAAAARKKVTPEEFLGPHAKLVDFDELVSKPTPASTLNPFAITIGKSSPASNPFVVKAQEEEKSKRVPLNQLQPSSDSMFGGGGIGIAPGSTMPPVAWPTAAVAVVYTSQPAVQASMQGGYNNPFL